MTEPRADDYTGDVEAVEEIWPLTACSQECHKAEMMVGNKKCHSLKANLTWSS